MSTAFDGAPARSYPDTMGIRFAPAAALATLISIVAPAAAAPAFAATEPDRSGAPLPFFRRDPVESFPRVPGANEGIPFNGPDAPLDQAARPDPGSPEGPPTKPPTRAETLDKLLDRLAKAQDAGEAQGIAGRVQGLWMQSGSDTADLLMTRAVAAMSGSRHDVAEALLDKIITLRPGWAEAWNKRATLRFLENDDVASMEDISHVLVLEPRHFGALSGMGFILERHGEDAAALKALRRALAVYPQDEEVRKAVEKLAPTVEGQDL